MNLFFKQKSKITIPFFCTLLGLLNVGRVYAQQPDTAALPTGAIKLPSGTLPVDSKKLTPSISESYYHPDDLSGLDCKVSVDWSSMLSSFKTEDAEKRLKILESITIHSHAIRDKRPELTFNWGTETLSTKEQLESGMNQMIGGFYQIYWPMIASFPFKNASDVKKIEPQIDGGAILYATDQNVNVVLTADKAHLPIHYSVESPMMKATMDPHYTPSPNPAPGDVNRLTSLKTTEQIGASTINLEVRLDYQPIGGFQIPHNVVFGLGPALLVHMEFSNCTISKDVKLTPETK